MEVPFGFDFAETKCLSGERTIHNLLSKAFSSYSIIKTFLSKIQYCSCDFNLWVVSISQFGCESVQEVIRIGNLIRKSSNFSSFSTTARCGKQNGPLRIFASSYTKFLSRPAKKKNRLRTTKLYGTLLLKNPVRSLTRSVYSSSNVIHRFKDSPTVMTQNGIIRERSPLTLGTPFTNAFIVLVALILVDCINSFKSLQRTSICSIRLSPTGSSISTLIFVIIKYYQIILFVVHHPWSSVLCLWSIDSYISFVLPLGLCLVPGSYPNWCMLCDWKYLTSTPVV
ncbi:hypothetical protein BX666DRAFT_907302 [Dichotomocladium elegans]|nr:hypothetical protein BX666DRAFT_907302 [Dichotomocladium elegans]